MRTARRAHPFFLSLALLIMGVCVEPAAGQQPLRRWEVFAQVGGSFFSGAETRGLRLVIDLNTGPRLVPTKRTTSFSQSARVFTGLRFYFTEHDALELNYSAGPNNVFFREVGALPDQPVGEVFDPSNTSAHIVSANYVRSFRSGRNYRPFLTVGLGRGIFPHTVDPVKFVGNLGGGLDIRLNQRVSLRTEYRVYLFDQPLAFLDIPAGMNIHHGPSAGLAFRF